MTADLPPLHADLTFLSPMSPERAASLASWLAAGLSEGGLVLVVGCGWAELLLRVSAAAPHARCVGVDLDENAVAEGRRRAASRGLVERVTLLHGAGATTGPTEVDALIAVGSTQVWGPPVEEAQPLAYADALTAIRSRVRRGARVVYGDGIWSRPPTAAAVAPLSGRLDEFVTLAELTDLAVDAGFAMAAVGEASLAEWDAFESGFTGGYATWLAGHPSDHPEAVGIRERAASQRASYLDGYRGVLGMGYLQLLAV